MNEYKVTIELDNQVSQEIIKATRIEYDNGFILFYENEILVATIFAPASVIKKP
jgi:hypothetical protein